MKSKKNQSWIIAGIVVLVAVIATVCLFHNKQNRPGPPPDGSGMDVMFKQGLDKLVASKVITEQQETSIINKLQSKSQNGMMPPPTGQPNQGASPLSSLVKDGTITQEQANVVEKSLPRPPSMGNGNSNGNGMPPQPPL